VSHDVRSKLITKNQLDATIKINNTLFVPINTKIASSTLINNHHLINPHSSEIDHIIIHPKKKPYNYNSHNYLKTIANTRTIKHQFKQLTNTAENTNKATKITRLITTHNNNKTTNSTTTIALQI